jgi:hypothetical protein
VEADTFATQLIMQFWANLDRADDDDVFGSGADLIKALANADAACNRSLPLSRSGRRSRLFDDFDDYGGFSDGNLQKNYPRNLFDDDNPVKKGISFIFRGLIFAGCDCLGASGFSLSNYRL